MKRQATGLVLCALLLSTFGHELRNRHQVAQSARNAHSPFLHHTSRSNKEGQCHLECVSLPGSCSTCQLEILINSTSNLAGIANTTAQVALVVDINANLVALLNAGSNSAIVVDIERSIGVSISGSAAWSKDKSFEEYFQSLTSLKVLFEQQGEKFSSSNIKEEISVQISETLNLLNSGTSSVEAKEAFQVLVIVSKLFSSSLQLLLKVVEIEGAIVVNNGLKHLAGILHGLGSFLGKLKGGIEALVKHQIKFNLAIILNLETSVDLLAYVLLQLKSKGVDPKEVLGDYINSAEGFFDLIAKLGGSSTDGFNGFLTVVSKIVALVHKHSSPQEVIVILIRYFGSASRDPNIKQEWQKAIEKLSKVIDQLQLSETLKDLVKLLHDIQEEKWIENKINLSVVIKVLIEINDSSSPLTSLIKALVAFTKVIAVEVSISILLLELVRLLTSRAGLAVLIILIPHLKIDVKGSTSVNLLVHIVRGIQIQDLLSGNIGKALQHIPVIKDIYIEIQRSLKDNAQLEIEVVLKRSGCRGILLEIRDVLIKAIHSGGEGQEASTQPSGQSESTKKPGSNESDEGSEGGQISGNGGASGGVTAGVSGGSGNTGISGGASGESNGGHKGKDSDSSESGSGSKEKHGGKKGKGKGGHKKKHSSKEHGKH